MRGMLMKSFRIAEGRVGDQSVDQGVVDDD
jgi:hypothetical protein